MKAKILLVAFLMLCFCLETFSQEGTSAAKVWTLRECVDYALNENLSVRRSEFAVENSQIEYNQAKLSTIPSLNASASHNYNWGRSINPVTNLFVSQEIQSNGLGAQSSVTLFNGFNVQNTIKSTRFDYHATMEDLSKSKNDVILNVALLYITVIFNKELLQTSQFQLNSSAEQLVRTKVQVSAGALPKSDELNMEAQVASNELNIINQENALNLSILQLKQAMQLPASSPLDVEMPALEVEDLILDQNREAIFETAVQSMPEIKSANLRRESSAYALRAARGNLSPRLSLSGSVNSNYSSASDRPRFVPDGGAPILETQQIGYVDGMGTPVLAQVEIPSGSLTDGYTRSNQFRDNIFRAVGVTLSIPVFNNLQARAGVQRAKISQQQAEVNALDARNQLRQTVETAYNDALAASKTYSASLKQVMAREEAFRMLQRRYENGAANFVEFQVSQNDLFQAQSDLTRAKYNFIFTKKVLDFYQNKPIDF